VGIETLEHRLVPDAASAAFAHFADQTVAAGEPAAVAIHVRDGDFTMPRGRVVLGFVTRATNDAQLDPGSAAVVSLGGASRRAILRKPDVAGELSGLTLAQVGVGDFAIRWRGQHDTGGATDLDVFLAGDADADFRVDSRDLDLIRSRAGAALGKAGYAAAADVNHDGVINRADVRLARLNLGAATTVGRPIVTASLDPASDLDGNGVVLKSDVTVVGQTQPGATLQVSIAVTLDQTEGVARSESSTRVQESGFLAPRTPFADSGRATHADANGRFRFAVDLAPGLNTIRVAAIDRFGQSVAVERAVRYGDVILGWNASLLDVIRDWTTLSNDPYLNRVVTERPPVAARNLAMVHAAMFDAVNAIEQTYQPYHVDLVAPEGASPVAASAAAAHRVASNLYTDPDELAVFDAALAEALGTVPDGPAETLGVELGQQVGDAILAWRSTDGANVRVPYTPGTEPGDWNRTFPDFLPPLLPQWPRVTPFAMTSDDQFRPAAPPALDSVEYAATVNEVMQVGRLDSTTRTPEQTEIALFWADGGGTFTPPGHWNQIAADVALDHGNTLAENARLFALLNIALADAGISAWDAKYVYNFWRPIDAIRSGDMDGNNQTATDATWTPLLKTPPFPTYTSGHSTFSGAADAVLSSFFGSDVHFTSQSDGHTGFSQRPLSENQLITRSFTSFAQAADEAGRSRIYGGIHFEFDNAAGRAAGRALGKYVMQTLLRPSSP
jgi:hypothetical protein